MTILPMWETGKGTKGTVNKGTKGTVNASFSTHFQTFTTPPPPPPQSSTNRTGSNMKTKHSCSKHSPVPCRITYVILNVIYGKVKHERLRASGSPRWLVRDPRGLCVLRQCHGCTSICNVHCMAGMVLYLKVPAGYLKVCWNEQLFRNTQLLLTSVEQSA